MDNYHGHGQKGTVGKAKIRIFGILGGVGKTRVTVPSGVGKVTVMFPYHCKSCHKGFMVPKYGKRCPHCSSDKIVKSG